MVGAVFRCDTEKEIFFQRLAEIAGLQKIVLQDDTVIMTVNSDYANQAVADVGAICDFWNADYRLRSGKC